MADYKSASWLIEFCITQGPSISVLGGVVHASRVVDSRHWTDIHYSQRQWCIYDIYEPSSWLNPPVLSAPLKPLPGVARLISCSLTAYLSHLPIYRFYRAKHIQHISVQRGICYGPLSVCPSVCHTLLLFLNSWTLFKHSTLNDIPADVNPNNADKCTRVSAALYHHRRAQSRAGDNFAGCCYMKKIHLR